MSLTKKKTKRLSDFDREFEKMKPFAYEESMGVCGARRFVFARLQENGFDVNRLPAELSAAWWKMDEVACGYQIQHVHHRKYRSRGGTNSAKNLIAICQNHHSWIHAHGGFGEPANLLGLALSANQSEEL